MLKNTVAILLFYAVCTTGARAQQALRVQAITVAEGLSMGYVSALYEDRRGFIWIGTFNGLNRYDGYRVKRYTQDNSAPWRLKSNFIYCIAEDTQGLLWIGTDQGPVVMDPYSERFVNLAETAPGGLDGSIAHIVERDDGRMWICQRKLNDEIGVCVVRPPAGLQELIREGRLTTEPFETQSVRLPADATGPFNWLSAINDSILIASDMQSRLFRIDPATLKAKRIEALDLPFQPFGNYGLFSSERKGQGFVFLPREIPDNQSSDVHRWSEFVRMPGEAPILYRLGDTVLFRLDTLLSRLQIPGHERIPFYRQFEPFIELDKPLSGIVLADRSGNLWLGTSGYGIRKISRRKLDFKQYLPGRSVYNFTLLPNGRLWPGIYNPNEVLNLQTGRLEQAPWAGRLPAGAWVYSLFIARNGDWWMTATIDHKLRLFKKDRTSDRWEQLPAALNWLKDVPVQFLEDRDGNIWIAGNDGDLLRIRAGAREPQNWNFRDFFPPKAWEKSRSGCIVQTADGNIWIGGSNGLLRVAHTDGEPVFTAFHNYTGKGPVFGNDWILSLYPDPALPHILWIGARDGGLNRFDSRTGASKIYKEKDGLANNVVYGILPDDAGYLWLSTNRGLSRFNPRNESFNNLQNAALELNTEFNTGAYRVMPDGQLAFGSIEGLFMIRPPRSQLADNPAMVAVTNIDVNGQNLDFSCDNDCLRFEPDQAFSLRLPYEKNNVAIEFAALRVSDPAVMHYRYRVKGLSEHWVNTGTQRNANLIGLPPGSYVLELQAKSPDDEWDSTTVSHLNLTILPPWYRSRPAWLVYGLLLFLLIRFYLRFVRKRLALEQDIAMSRKETEQLKALDDFKNRFFAYISHEFKTPLTIILGLARRLGQEPSDRKNTLAYSTDIIREGQNVLELVEQMLDIARLDDNQLQLQWRQGNVSQYLRYLVESYRPLADFRKINLAITIQAPGLVMDFDPQRLKYIIGNLLSNAIRHTPSGGAVRVELAQATSDLALITVSDTGEGIHPEDLPNVFDRYFRGKNEGRHNGGIGLGLAFVKDLVHLFKGQIEVRSAPGQGAVFSITLPITREAPPLEPVPGARQQPSATATAKIPASGGLPYLLVVEDNPVIVDYLKLCLQEKFRLTVATDGETGWKQTLEQIPDLVLTDVMLPRIDGLELTRRIKSHELTSHIPVVMLSARSEPDDRLAGQQEGADAYLAKPFREQELLLVLQNMHALQRRWQERYAALTATGVLPSAFAAGPVSDPAPVGKSDAFMTKLYEIFDNNLSNDSYDLPLLCRDLEISKSQLQRKLAALSEQTAMELLRRYRLQKAYELLRQQPGISVKEVCFQVGFKDPAHFSRMFSKAFGTAPSEVRNK